MISRAGISINPSKIEAVLSWKSLTIVSGVRSFWVWPDIVDVSLEVFPKLSFHLLNSLKRIPSLF